MDLELSFFHILPQAKYCFYFLNCTFLELVSVYKVGFQTRLHLMMSSEAMRNIFLMAITYLFTTCPSGDYYKLPFDQ